MFIIPLQMKEVCSSKLLILTISGMSNFISFA